MSFLTQIQSDETIGFVRAIHFILQPNWFNPFLCISALIVSASVSVSLAPKLNHWQLAREAEQKSWVSEKAEAPPLHSLQIFKTVSLGHWPAAVDWLFIRMLANPSITHVSKGKHADTFYLLDLAAQLDPAFYEIYSSGAALLTVVRNDNLGAIKILERGEGFRSQQLSQYPEDFRKRYWELEGYIPFLLGYVYMFEEGNLELAQKYFEIAASLPKAPPHLLGLAKRLKDPSEQKRLKIAVIQSLLQRKLEPEVEQKLKQDLLKLIETPT